MNYRYSIEMIYMHKTAKNTYKQYDFDLKNVRNMIIHSDYVKNNMPIGIVEMAVPSYVANIMLESTSMQNDYMILHINKVDKDDELGIELPYIAGEFIYYSFDPLNKAAKLDYQEGTNHEFNNLRVITLGLFKKESIMANNNTMYNHILSNTTMQDYIQSCLNNAGVSTLVEQFDYNTKINQIILSPRQTLSTIIAQLNDIAVFYKTRYRFFIDYDLTYLISSSGESVPRKGESISSIMFDIGDVDGRETRIEGMTVIKKQNLYYIPVVFGDCELADNFIRSQQYTELSVISSSGAISSALDVRKGDNSTNAMKTVRIGNDNVHMLENIASNIANSNTSVHISKVGADNSIFTPNKKYTIQYNNNYDNQHNGEYLLNAKQELFIRDGDKFVGTVILTLAKIGS